MPFSAGQVGVFVSIGFAGLVGYVAFIELAAYEDLRLTATTLVALSGTLTGFIMTALSLLVGVADRPFITNLRLTGHYRNLVTSLFLAAGLWLSVVTIGLVGHMTSGTAQRFFVALAIAATVLALLKFVSVGRKFRIVVQELTRK